MFNLFLEFFVFPALQRQTGNTRRYIMADQLAAHVCARTQAAVEAAGHVPLIRPVHSPDFGPVECCFDNLLQFLRRYETVLTSDNLFAFVSFWAAWLKARKVRGYYASSGYAVPGRRFRPYV
jgi:transposase